MRARMPRRGRAGFRTDLATEDKRLHTGTGAEGHARRRPPAKGCWQPPEATEAREDCHLHPREAPCPRLCQDCGLCSRAVTSATPSSFITAARDSLAGTGDSVVSRVSGVLRSGAAVTQPHRQARQGLSDGPCCRQGLWHRPATLTPTPQQNQGALPSGHQNLPAVAGGSVGQQQPGALHPTSGHVPCIVTLCAQRDLQENHRPSENEFPKCSTVILSCLLQGCRLPLPHPASSPRGGRPLLARVTLLCVSVHVVLREGRQAQ